MANYASSAPSGSGTSAAGKWMVGGGGMGSGKTPPPAVPAAPPPASGGGTASPGGTPTAPPQTPFHPGGPLADHPAAPLVQNLTASGNWDPLTQQIVGGLYQ